MEAKDWISVSAVAVSLLIAVMSVLRTASTQRRLDELRELHREDTPHIEFSIDCRVHGQEHSEYLVEFVLTAHNKGLVQWKFQSILLRVRGIEENRPLEYWGPNKPRLQFPIGVIDKCEVIPGNLNFVFVEPGVLQTITFVTKIASSIKYVLVHAEFDYEASTPHTTERVFHLKPPSGRLEPVHGLGGKPAE